MSLLRPTTSPGVTSGRQLVARSDQSAAVTNLEGTIASFQAILTDDDRQKMQRLKSTAHDAQSIVMFTAELDRIDANRRGKSVASRLASFLQTIEQFSPIIDTYVQSNPQLAALIWGSVKLTFKILANFTSYFVSFVEQLHGFGTLCSRFAEYQVIFTDSPRLKNSICEFHSAVITCCEQIVLGVRRPLKAKAWSMLTESFQSQIGGYVDGIKSKAEIVREDIQLAKVQADQVEQQLQAEDRQEAARSRKTLSSWFSKSTSEMEAIREREEKAAAEQKRYRLLKDLSSFNYTTAFNNIRIRRHRHTAEWMFDTDEFQSWFESDKTEVLHITGKIGSGKSVATSSVVEYLCRKRTYRQFVSYFFSQFDNPQSLTWDTIVRSVVQQLLSAAPVDSLDASFASDLAACLESAKKEFFSREALESLYTIASAAFSEWFIVLDGVDECEPYEQIFLFNFFSRLLRNLPKSRTVKLLIAGRVTTVKHVDQSFGVTPRLITGSTNTSDDIITYAEDVIKAKQETEELVVRNPELIEEVLRTIAAKEEGMFLWAFLTIEDICSKNTDADIRRTLQDIPTGLPATFERALGRIVQRRSQEIAKDIFSWAAAVREPLTLSQLQEALSVKVGQRTLNPDDLVSGIHRVPIWCENLVCVEETDSTVHFSHHSISMFLLFPDAGEYRDFHLNKDKCDLKVGEICVTYLNLEGFRTALIETHQNEATVALNIDMGELAKQTVQAAVKGKVGSRVAHLASRAVRSTARHSNTEAKHTMMSVEAPMSNTPPPPSGMRFPFFEYAAEYWFQHRICLNDRTEDNTWNLLGRILTSPHHAIKLPWMNRPERRSLLRSLRSNLPSWAQYLADRREGGLLYLAKDEKPLRNLIFAVIYASQNGNWGLACRAFMMVVEESRVTELTRPVIQFMAAKGHHDSCPNSCLLMAQQHLDHKTLVSAVTQCISNGLTHWPASKVAASPCECSGVEHGIQADVCKFIESGYNAEADPCFRAFATIATGLIRGVTLSILCQKLELAPSALFHARTSTHKSIIDLAVERNMSDNVAFIKSFFEYFRTTVPNPSQWNTQSLATSGLCLVLRHGVSPTAKVLLKQCLDDGGADLQSEESILSVLSDTINFFWPLEMSKKIVAAFFGEAAKPSLKSCRKILFEKCVVSNNWNFASALADLEPNLAADFESGQWFHFLTEALRCEECRERSQAEIKGVELLKLSDHIYEMCSWHTKEARIVERNPHMALNAFAGTLRWDIAEPRRYEAELIESIASGQLQF
ncbi:hypothetical protein NM208_g1346 [Fusarium decemcellulare]|uniref:Uncharacterized protein n=2 Tax=Fusarium decemcellulare TaxID=57161 RepID=A0ACC1SWZ8_9HYPO|nr:hypothetical protein NM208_g4370 [Fusarium decemcellulare]KAJ3547762.1 hypothetical protein NM208_g1346 [Fusarium decemcellulare]